LPENPAQDFCNVSGIVYSTVVGAFEGHANQFKGTRHADGFFKRFNF
jgi:hypothetical protein